MMIRCATIILLLILTRQMADAQCCASAGNPIGGTIDVGILNAHKIRFVTFYRISNSDKYFTGDKVYTGEIGTLKRAQYNYTGILAGYGLSDKISFGLETGYFISKTHIYKINNQRISLKGMSDIFISFKPKIYRNLNYHLDISCAVGPNIPASRTLKSIDGVTVSRDLQPSMGSFGLFFQTYIIKEYPFRSINFLLINRIEKYFENKQNYLFGNTYTNSLYFSKYYHLENSGFKGITAILQLKNQIKEKNIKEGQFVDASGSCVIFLLPQVNFSIGQNWIFFILSDFPLYQYYNNVQLSKNPSFAAGVIKDFSFK